MKKTGVSIIKDYVTTAPSLPGVYRMLDSSGKVLYVGKAKNLKKRIANYTNQEKLSSRIRNMVFRTCSMEIIITETELESLLLEANLIKKFSPKYNILLKDGKSHPYICIDTLHDYPRIFKYRCSGNSSKDKKLYFGPFPSVDAVNKSVSDICRAFLLRTCTDNEFSRRTRPCMEYQVKHCSAPCVNKISKEDYKNLVEQVKLFINGKNKSIQEDLIKMMRKESSLMNYEKALIYRERIKALNKIQEKQNINIKSPVNADVIALYRQNNECCVQVFFFRNGSNLGNSPRYFSVDTDIKNSEIIDMFLLQYYKETNIISDIILSEPPTNKKLLEEALKLQSGEKILLSVPKRGEKKAILENALVNAKEALSKELLSQEKHSYALSELAELFELEQIPERIEIYDNSHISGKYDVGVMVVSGSRGFIKSEYRKFNIKGKDFTKGDDYSMLKEVLSRRLQRLIKEYPEKEKGVWPDFLLIDGGEGHLSVAQEVLKKLSLTKDIKLVCISKGVDRNAGREKFHMVGKASFTLPKGSSVLYYLQLLRDEAHNFAITNHKNLRNKSMVKSSLDLINGIGKNKKRLLLNYFGSVSAIKEASVQDLMKIKGISKLLANEIYSNFH